MTTHKTIRVSRKHLRQVLNENAMLREKVTELQARGNVLLEDRREHDRRYQVSEFHRVFGQPVQRHPDPSNVSEDTLQLRLALVAEEVFEMLEACGADSLDMAKLKAASSNALNQFKRERSWNIDLVKLVDALADIDYVVEGFRLTLGVDGGPISAIVHKTNMAKRGGPIDPQTGKQLKPPGWVGPEKAIREELERQGWQPWQP